MTSFAVLIVAVAVALSGCASAATLESSFSLEDVCGVEISLLYPNLESENITQELTIFSPDFELEIQPGVGMTVSVAMKPCVGSTAPVCDTSNPANDVDACADWNDAGGNAFSGSSAPFDFNGDDETPIILNIICSDMGSVYNPVNLGILASENSMPLVMQLNIAPTKLRFGASAAIQASAQDIFGGVGILAPVTPESWSITPMTTLEASQFTPEGNTCAGSTSCTFGFDAVAGPKFMDQGNIGFTVVVTGDNGVSSAQIAAVNVDPRGTVRVGVSVMNIPEITTTKADVEAEDSGYEAELSLDDAQGSLPMTSTFEIKVLDRDLAITELEELRPIVSSESKVMDKRVEDGTHIEVNCSEIISWEFNAPTAAQIESPSLDDMTATLNVTVDPSVFDASGADIGITHCRFTVHFEDNSSAIAQAANPDKTLSAARSQDFVFDHIIWPSMSSLGGDFSKYLVLLPQIESTLLSPKTIESADQVVNFAIQITDATFNDDISIVLVASTGEQAVQDLNNSASWVNSRSETEITLISESTDQLLVSSISLASNGADCAGTSGCRLLFRIPYYEFLGVGAFTVFVVDGDDVYQSDNYVSEEYEFDGIDAADAGGRRRRNAPAQPTTVPSMPFTTDVQDGKLKGSLTPEFLARMGTPTADPSDAPTQPPAGASPSDSSSTVIIGASAGAAIALIAVVAAVVVNRKNRSGKVYPVASAGFQANPALQDRSSATWF